MIEELIDKQVILYGMGSRGKRVLNNLLYKGFKKENILVYDSDPAKQGTQISGITVMDFPALKKLLKLDVIISSSIHYEIKKDLEKLGFTKIHHDHNIQFSNMIYDKFDSEFQKIMNDNSCFMDLDERYTLYSCMIAVSKLDGDIAEVGVYKGGSAKILCNTKKNKSLHLFDTFEGRPDNQYHNDTSLEYVRNHLSKYENVLFHKGIFPSTASIINDKLFCLVHLDVDSYNDTSKSLQYFLPRMVKFGRIIIHDYNAIPEVKKAVDELISSEKLIEIADTQAIILC